MILVGLAIDQIAQSGLSSLSVIYYSAQLFRYFNKTLNSNQFDNEDAIKDKLDNRGSIKGKLNNIYGKSIDYAALRHRDIIIAKIDLFIQRITHNLWHARKKMCF